MLAALGACSPQAPAQSNLDQPYIGMPAPRRSLGADGEPQMGLPRMGVIFHSRRGDYRFTLDVAKTPQEQEKGLMFARSLAPYAGMMFPYDPPQEVAFWMKNTLIPLDIIFVRPDNTIARIATAKPLDLTPIPSGEPIAVVIEIAAGRAAELGITAGDRVDLPPPVPCCKP